MQKIDPSVLKRLRTEKGLSLEELATRAKIDKQTIWRLEHGSRANSTRERIIQSLARALNVAPPVLTGESPLPEIDDDSRYFLMSKLGFRVSTSTHNALYLASGRYNVSQQEIVELAPFLFCWAAEASLQQRRDRLEKSEATFQGVQRLEAEMRHLATADLSNLDHKLAAERQSIDMQDLFGMCVDDDEGSSHYPEATYDEGTENPFAIFLHELAKTVAPTVTFESYPSFECPAYRICPEEADLIARGDKDLADAILEGHVPLNEMPKEYRALGPKMYEKRNQWARDKAEEFRQRMIAMIEQRQASESTP